MAVNELFPQLHRSHSQKKTRNFTVARAALCTSILFLTLGVGRVQAEEKTGTSKILPPTGGPQALLVLPSALLPGRETPTVIERAVITDPGNLLLPLPPVVPVLEKPEILRCKVLEAVLNEKADK